MKRSFYKTKVSLMSQVGTNLQDHDVNTTTLMTTKSLQVLTQRKNPL